MDTSARQRRFEIRVFPLLAELPKAIEPHLPVCQLYRWQLGPNMWSSPITKSLDPIVVATLGLASHGKSTIQLHANLPAIVRSQRRGQRRSQGKGNGMNGKGNEHVFIPQYFGRLVKIFYHRVVQAECYRYV